MKNRHIKLLKEKWIFFFKVKILYFALLKIHSKNIIKTVFKINYELYFSEEKNSQIMILINVFKNANARVSIS